MKITKVNLPPVPPVSYTIEELTAEEIMIIHKLLGATKAYEDLYNRCIKTPEYLLYEKLIKSLREINFKFS